MNHRPMTHRSTIDFLHDMPIFTKIISFALIELTILSTENYKGLKIMET